MSATDWNELDGYEALVSQLRANAPAAPESLRERVMEGAPAPRRRRSRKQRLLFVVVPAAIVLAVGAALVHGFVSSGSRNNVAAFAPHALATGKTTPDYGPPAAAGHAQQGSLKNAQSKVVHGSSFAQDTPASTVASADLAGVAAKSRRVDENA